MAAFGTINTTTDIATTADLNGHVTDSADAHDASAISTVPAGNLAASDVQAALNELDTEKATSGHTHTQIISIPLSDPQGPPVSIGDGKGYFRVPSTLNGWTITAVSGSLTRASDSGIVTVQLRRKRSGSDVDVLSVELTIDATEVDSSTATTGATINTSNDDINTGDQLYGDVDIAGTGAKGLILQLTVQS